MSLPPKPRPTIGPDSAPFWAALAAGRLDLPFCTRCGRAHLPAGPVCPFCLGPVAWRPASGRGHLASWTVVRKPLSAPFRDDLPYTIALVELDEGPRLISGLVGAPPEALAAGLPVEIVFDRVDAELTLHRFRLIPRKKAAT